MKPRPAHRLETVRRMWGFFEFLSGIAQVVDAIITMVDLVTLPFQTVKEPKKERSERARARRRSPA